MPRRVSLPGASELFRPTEEPPVEVAVTPVVQAEEPPKASGRVRHDEKITVYVSSDELMGLEEGRLLLRREGLAADRGRIVRESIALAMEDLRVNGAASALARRLGGR